VVQSHLARTYRTLADQGPGALYGGELGRRLVEHSDRNQGWFTLDDLAAHRVDWTAPIETRYRGRRVLTHPPNSQGIALLMQADLLDQFEPEWFDPDEEEWIHLMVEAKKLAFADRDRWVCDPDFMPVSTERLLDRGAAKGRAALITPERAAESPAPRRFADGGRDTVYLAVVDAAGNAVSLIQSIYMSFGSRSVVPDTGIILHNRALGFSVDPDHPNHLAPKKRPYHTLHPAMILDGDRPTHVLGSPGADGQTQTVMQLIGRLIDFGYQPQAAVEAPRWRSQPDGTLWLESRFSPPVVSALAAKGHDARLAGPYDPLMGSAQVIAIDPDQGVLAAGACPRRQAYAAGR
jgi:gamma-glutamyltranspeptidase/glutathione hydrolase